MRSLRLLFSHREFVVLMAGNVVYGLGFSLVVPYLSLFGTRELGLSPWGFGLFMTASGLVGIAFSTRIARWSDIRFTRKAVLLAGGLCGAASQVCFAFLRQPWVLLAVTSVLGGIASVTFSQIFAQARDLLGRRGVPEKEAPFYINVFRLCFALAWTVGPALGAFLLERHSFTASFLASAGLLVVFTALIALGIAPHPPTAQARAAAAAMPLRKAIGLPGFLAHFIAFILLLGCATIGMNNLPLLILGPLGGDEGNVGVAYSLAPIFELPLMFYAGLLATRLPPVRIIRWAALLAVAYYAGLALAREPWHVYPLQVLSAALVAVTSGLAITFFQDFLPGQAGTATNVYANAARIGSLAGYLLFGVLGTTLGYRAVFWACALACGTAWIIMRRWPPRHPAPVDPVVPADAARPAGAVSG